MYPDRELAGVVAQHQGIVQEAVCLNTAPQRPFCGDAGRILDCGQSGAGGGGNVQSRQMRLPGLLIGEMPFRAAGEPVDQRRRQATLSHILEAGCVQHEVGMAGPEHVKKVQSALARPRAEPGDMIVADLRAKAVPGLVAGAGVVDRYPGRGLKPGTQHVTGLPQERIVLFSQQTLHLTFGDRHAHRAQQGLTRGRGDCP